GELRDRDRRENPDDHHNDEELDQGKAVPRHHFVSLRPRMGAGSWHTAPGDPAPVVWVPPPPSARAMLNPWHPPNSFLHRCLRPAAPAARQLLPSRVLQALLPDPTPAPGLRGRARHGPGGAGVFRGRARAARDRRRSWLA